MVPSGRLCSYIVHMAQDDKYSRMISRLKVVLPLIALATLSTLFLVAETLDPEAAIPFAEVDIDQILEDQGITQPSFGGVTTDNAKVALSAETVRPEGELFAGRALELTIDLPNGGSLSVVSPDGLVDMVRQEAQLSGGVRIESSAGYDLVTESVRAGWSVAMLETQSDIVATGPGGRIEAGRMHLTAIGETDAHLLVFKDGVRLIYDPNL